MSQYARIAGSSTVRMPCIARAAKVVLRKSFGTGLAKRSFRPPIASFVGYESPAPEDAPWSEKLVGAQQVWPKRRERETSRVLIVMQSPASKDRATHEPSARHRRSKVPSIRKTGIEGSSNVRRSTSLGFSGLRAISHMRVDLPKLQGIVSIQYKFQLRKSNISRLMLRLVRNAAVCALGPQRPNDVTTKRNGLPNSSGREGRIPCPSSTRARDNDCGPRESRGASSPYRSGDVDRRERWDL